LAGTRTSARAARSTSAASDARCARPAAPAPPARHASSASGSRLGWPGRHRAEGITWSSISAYSAVTRGVQVCCHERFMDALLHVRINPTRRTRRNQESLVQWALPLTSEVAGSAGGALRGKAHCETVAAVAQGGHHVSCRHGRGTARRAGGAGYRVPGPDLPVRVRQQPADPWRGPAPIVASAGSQLAFAIRACSSPDVGVLAPERDDLRALPARPTSKRPSAESAVCDCLSWLRYARLARCVTGRCYSPGRRSSCPLPGVTGRAWAVSCRCIRGRGQAESRAAQGGCGASRAQARRLA
jgi:hypothetical protein